MIDHTCRLDVHVGTRLAVGVSFLAYAGKSSDDGSDKKV